MLDRGPDIPWYDEPVKLATPHASKREAQRQDKIAKGQAIQMALRSIDGSTFRDSITDLLTTRLTALIKDDEEAIAYIKILTSLGVELHAARTAALAVVAEHLDEAL